MTENLPTGHAGKFSKYLLYAIDGIVLVVIGILIAWQINNWKIAGSKERMEKTYINGIIQNVKD